MKEWQHGREQLLLLTNALHAMAALSLSFDESDTLNASMDERAGALVVLELLDRALRQNAEMVSLMSDWVAVSHKMRAAVEFVHGKLETKEAVFHFIKRPDLALIREQIRQIKDRAVQPSIVGGAADSRC